MRIVVFEVQDDDSDIFDKIMEIVKSHPDIECLQVKDEPMLSLPGLEIYPGGERFTVTAGRSTLPQRSMTFCACLRQTGGRCSHTTRYTGRSGEKIPMGMRAMPSDAISAICGKSCTRRSRMRRLPSGA